MDIEKEYQAEFKILTKEGRLVDTWIKGQKVDNWSNVYEHCKAEGIVAVILSKLFKLSNEESDILIKSAILHDWYKRNERESTDKKGASEIGKSEKESYDKLIELGYNERIVEVAHSVGALSLKNILSSSDLLKKLMHYIDDICHGDTIVGVNKRIDFLESQDKYKEFNELGRKEYEGRLYFDVQREVGNRIQAELEILLDIKPNTLFEEIKKEYGEYTKK